MWLPLFKVCPLNQKLPEPPLGQVYYADCEHPCVLNICYSVDRVNMQVYNVDHANMQVYYVDRVNMQVYYVDCVNMQVYYVDHVNI